MPTIQQTTIPTLIDNVRCVQWPVLANGDDGVSIPFGQYTDKSVQVAGVFGAGGTLLLEGSNDGTNWAVLTDPQGNPLSFTSAKIEQIMEATRLVRPRVSAGDGTTSLTITVLMKETR